MEAAIAKMAPEMEAVSCYWCLGLTTIVTGKFGKKRKEVWVLGGLYRVKEIPVHDIFVSRSCCLG